jgi:hypothetical protein
MNATRADLVCISHLWWDWVWQRPQHLLSRLARQYRVFWVEEPHIEIGSENEGFEISEEYPNLSVGRLMYRSDAATFWDRLNETLDRTGGHAFKVSEDIREASLLFNSPIQERLEQEVGNYVVSWRRGSLVLWLYTPVVVKFIDILKPDLVVYDVMDELSAFKFAPRASNSRSKNCWNVLISSLPEGRAFMKLGKTVIPMFTFSPAAWSNSTLRERWRRM